MGCMMAANAYTTQEGEAFREDGTLNDVAYADVLRSMHHAEPV
jgi:hypothetical protein